MNIRIVFVLVLTLISFVVNAQTSKDLNCKFVDLYIQGNMAGWEKTVDSLQLVKLNRVDGDVLLVAQYGLIGYFLSQQDKVSAEKVVKKYENHLNQKMEQYPNNANYHALKAAMYGFKIGISPWKAPYYSYLHQREVDKALQLRKQHEALPIIEQANSYYFRPMFVGGDKNKALLAYEKAQRIIENDPNCNWLLLSNGSWLGQVFTKLGHPEKAKSTYLSLLQRAPGFQFVKNELLPQLERGEFIDKGADFEKLLVR